FTVTAEAAESDSGSGGIHALGGGDPGIKSGRAGRVEASLALSRLSAKVRALHTGADFDNPSAGFVSGREEYGFEVRGGLGKRTVLFVNGIRTRDLRTSGTRDGAVGGVSQRIWLGMMLDLTWRWERETTQPATALSAGTIPSKSNLLGG